MLTSGRLAGVPEVVAYKACHRCWLLFEVEAALAADAMSCPQCNGAIEDYEPDENEVP